MESARNRAGGQRKNGQRDPRIFFAPVPLRQHWTTITSGLFPTKGLPQNFFEHEEVRAIAQGGGCKWEWI